MDASSLDSESHVAPQSRRDKLRVFQQYTNPNHCFTNNFLDYHHGRLNPDLVRNNNGNLNIYDPSASYSSDKIMLNFERGSIVDQELGSVQLINRPMPLQDSSLPIVSNFIDSAKPGTSTGNDPQRSGTWGNFESPQNYDWMVNSVNASVVVEKNPKTMFFGDAPHRLSNISTSMCFDLKPSNYLPGNQNVQVQSTLVTSSPASREISSQNTPKEFVDHMNFSASSRPPHQNNIIQDVTTLNSIRYGNHQSNALLFDNANVWMNRESVDNCHQWSGELGLIVKKNEHELIRPAPIPNDHANNTHQGLSLSLFSNPPIPKGNLNEFGDRYESEFLQYSKPSIISKSCGKLVHVLDMAGSSNSHMVLRNATGPLGPFTGYAAILKTSTFLKPSQELLDECCRLTCHNLIRSSEVLEKKSGEVWAPASADTVNVAGDTEAVAKCNITSGVSTSTFYSSNEGRGDGGVGSSTCESFGPEYQQKKAKLLYLQEEVCRKYKQYNQQLQMVASAFESVAGLTAATPYLAFALRTVSTNFRSLKHSISHQLKNVGKILGEDLSPPNIFARKTKGDTSASRLRYVDQSFQKSKSNGDNVGYPDNHQHIWRPQRGLPERSVSILRSWLFEHFLHPYPTDTDKHMLATQTGLSRNQVSNWFMNARVRIWKPMVEEIHSLETKCVAETQNSITNARNPAEGSTQPNANQPPNRLRTHSMSNKQTECSGRGSLLGSVGEVDAEQWNHEKRSKVQTQVPRGMDGSSLANFVPYLGAVSLTLGLRHRVDNVGQQNRQVQEQEHQFQRRQFGGQMMIHDFVG